MPSSPDPSPPTFFEILCGLLLSSSANKSDRDGLGHVLPFSIPACQGRPPIFFEISGCIARFFRNPLRPWWPLFVLWRASSRGRPFEGFPDASPGVLQGTRIKATKGGVCIERTSEIMWKSINGPLQDLWLTRAGGVRPVGTPLYPCRRLARYANKGHQGWCLY